MIIIFRFVPRLFLSRFFNIFSGELDMRLEVDTVGIYKPRKQMTSSPGGTCQSEKMTQTEEELLERAAGGGGKTSPCNHPSLTCQVRINNKTVGAEMFGLMDINTVFDN